jgi:phosphoserine phosphatase RsbU/P
MKSLGSLRVAAKIENLRTIIAFIQSVGQQLQLTSKMLFDLELAVEEAVTNIAMHGYEDLPGGDMQVELRFREPDKLYIYLSDWGHTYDPSSSGAFDYDAGIEIRSKGGMGVHFIRSLMDEVGYTSASEPGGKNTLTLTKTVERLKAGALLPSALRELNAMLRISQSMMTSIDLDQLLGVIINNMLEVVSAEYGILYLLDIETEQLVSRVVVGSDALHSEIRFQPGCGIAGYVAAEGAIVNLKQPAADPRYDAAIDTIGGHVPQSLLAIPLYNPQKAVIGVMQLLDKAEGNFSSRDERLLTAIAAQAAISIEVARLHEAEIEQQLINQELKTANNIQKSFLPEVLPTLAGWDIGAVWTPVREVAGDFYDFNLLPDGRLAVVIADVSGKGVPAALFMALTVTVLRFALSLNLRPGELLDRANTSIISNQQSRMFVTAFIAYLQPASGAVEFANGGHNPTLLYRASTGAVEYIHVPGVAMGVFPTAVYDEGDLQLEAGDILVLYTDGITEAINSDDDEYGEERLERIVIEHAALDAQSIADQIIGSVKQHCNGQAAFDDETLVVLKRTG